MQRTRPRICRGRLVRPRQRSTFFTRTRRCLTRMVGDTLLMVSRREATNCLTPAQEQFAEENRASVDPRLCADERMVLFYREGPMLTRRWLVDQEGRVIRFDAFARRT